MRLGIISIAVVASLGLASCMKADSEKVYVDSVTGRVVQKPQAAGTPIMSLSDIGGQEIILREDGCRYYLLSSYHSYKTLVPKPVANVEGFASHDCRNAAIYKRGFGK
jgi:hypothetical protein